MRCCCEAPLEASQLRGHVVCCQPPVLSVCLQIQLTYIESLACCLLVQDVALVV